MLWGDQRGYDISKKVKISFIGGGAMASAFVEALFSKSVASEDCVAVSSRSWATLGVVHERHHVHTVLPNREVALLGDVVLLAVKPRILIVSCDTCPACLHRSEPERASGLAALK